MFARYTLDLAADLRLGGPAFCHCATGPRSALPTADGARQRLHNAARLAGVTVTTTKIAPGLIKATINQPETSPS